jgi:hypothetical protein
MACVRFLMAVSIFLFYSGCSITPDKSVMDLPSDVTHVSAPLDFSSALQSTTSATTRVFKNTAGATTEITVDGICDTNSGDVVISGSGLTAVTTASCTDGAFSKVIYYETGLPAFTADFGAKKINITQSGQIAVTTTLFKAATTHTSISLITSATQLAAMALTADSYFILANDIDLEEEVGVLNNWTALAPTAGGVNFQGVLEGDGHTISNLNVSSGRGFIDLFGGSVSSPATISNLNLIYADVTCGTSACGLLVGTAGQYSSINSVTVSGMISGTTSIGGIVGVENGKHTMTSGNATVSGTTGVGVAAGASGSTAVISQVKVIGSASGTTGSMGGLVGAANGTISDSYSTASVSGNGATRVGGLIGKFTAGSIAHCITYGDVSATGTTLSDPAVGNDLSGQAATAVLYDSSAACTGCTGNGFTAETPTQLKATATFMNLGFDFITPIWINTDGVSYPTLIWETP